MTVAPSVFSVETINRAGDIRVYCWNCNRDFVMGGRWHGKCVWCGRYSRMPTDRAVIYDSHHTWSTTVRIAQLLVGAELAHYSPEDGPNGIMYRPSPGLWVPDLKRKVVEDPSEGR